MLALVPIRSFTQGKTRLANELDVTERQQLIQVLFWNVLDALKAVPAITDIVVLSKDQSVLNDVKPLGCHVYHETPADNLNSALQDALFANRHRAKTALIIHADIPLANKKALSFFCEHHLEGDLTLLPSHDFQGTNALITDCDNPVNFVFGHSSYPRFLQEAKQAGVTVRTIALPELAFDVDVNSDLVTLQQLGFLS